jgi:hypothetical protein
MVIAPILVMTAYLLASQSLHFGPGFYFWAFGLSLLVGVTLVWQLSAGARHRPFLVLGYLLVAIPFLFLYTHSFVCGVFGDCL